jgi:hypothetical protein
MQGEQIYDGAFLRILWEPESSIIAVDWKESAASMTGEDFKAALGLFADHVERRGSRGILVDVGRFRHVAGPGVQEWRVKRISGRYITRPEYAGSRSCFPPEPQFLR